MFIVHFIYFGKNGEEFDESLRMQDKNVPYATALPESK